MSQKNTKEKILQKTQGKTHTINVPEWNMDVLLREVTLAERFQILSWVKNNSEDPNFIFKLLSLCWVDENNKQLFTEKELKNLSGDMFVFIRLGNEAARINSLGETPVEEAKKNLEEVQN